LFLVHQFGQWLAIHAPKGSSHAEVVARDADNVAFVSEEDILTAGPHSWRVPPDSALNPANPRRHEFEATWSSDVHLFACQARWDGRLQPNVMTFDTYIIQP
jgi:hypothetical protein